MANSMEDKGCYASPAQREVLVNFIAHPDIEKNFFLTGGTALSVFYPHHRISDDLDLFAKDFTDLSEIGFWIKSRWPNESVTIKEASQVVSFLVGEGKVDLVIDRLSTDEQRSSHLFETGRHLFIDTINNIVSNKLCAVVSRTEPKDYIDLFMILKSFSNIEISDVYRMSRLKDAIFDDPPTAAYQLETGIAFIKENPTLIPTVLQKIDMKEFYEFYEKLAQWLYARIKISTFNHEGHEGYHTKHTKRKTEDNEFS